MEWRLADQPRAYSRSVAWADGRRTVQGSVERPQLLLDADGRPTHLVAATADRPWSDAGVGSTWTMVVPLAP